MGTNGSAVIGATLILSLATHGTWMGHRDAATEDGNTDFPWMPAANAGQRDLR